ncbi:MAG: ferredoxin:glutaredoxin reductase [Candidatus Latescibacteria bacterium]|nr:ferredoxin:glutaredoxin reductase [Candidatus Latescibacterota bacterium]
MNQINVAETEIEALYNKIKIDAEAGGYYLNSDFDFTKDLIKGLLINEKRYGYQSCPCRITSGSKENDLDIICPCDYRDADLTDYGACYCALYVSQAIAEGRAKAGSIPERRNQTGQVTTNTTNKTVSTLPLPVWRCKVCGYLCARESAPEICPICKVKKERFERFV